MPFEVKAWVHGRLVKASADTAKEVFALAVEWQVANCAWGLSISDGSRRFTIAEFAWAMASEEIANTARDGRRICNAVDLIFAGVAGDERVQPSNITPRCVALGQPTPANGAEVVGRARPID
jgi:hypothetical protein